MEFIKGNEIVKIDPSGVEILGGGHISINSKEITGDISINGNITVLDKFITNSNAEFKGVVTLENLLDINGKQPLLMISVLTVRLILIVT